LIICRPRSKAQKKLAIQIKLSKVGKIKRISLGGSFCIMINPEKLSNETIIHQFIKGDIINFCHQKQQSQYKRFSRLVVELYKKGDLPNLTIDSFY